MKSKKATWGRAIISLVGSLLLVLSLRWALFEPYVIPSGSMFPTLLIKDYILVNKFAYGLRIPFSHSWLVRWQEPQAGEIVVFRAKDDTNRFLIKRVVAGPGDEVRVDQNGRLFVNGSDLTQRLISDYRLGDEPFDAVVESFPKSSDVITLRAREPRMRSFGPQKVPQGHIFVMGDNRDFSLDSRSWGALPLDLLLGRAQMIWLSCGADEFDLTGAFCEPQNIRFHRLFQRIR